MNVEIEAEGMERLGRMLAAWGVIEDPQDVYTGPTFLRGQSGRVLVLVPLAFNGRKWIVSATRPAPVPSN